MLNYLLIRGGNLALRLLSMGAKFLLIAAITKQLGTETLGEYGLFTVAITILLYFIGFDFYTFSSREILGKEKSIQKILIRDQFIFHCLSYFIILPVIVLIYIYGIFPSEYIFIFVGVLIFEHLAQELYRIFVLLSQSLLANFLLFIRTGSWCYFAIFVWFFGFSETYNLRFIYISWALSALLSIVISLYYLYKQYGTFFVKEKINWEWIKKGIYISFPFFIGTICYKIIEFSNRYIIDFYSDKKDVGIFVFFFSITNAVQVIIYTIVIMIFYPKMISLYNERKFIELRKLKKNFYIEVIAYSLLIGFILWLCVDLILLYMEKNELMEYKGILYVMLISSFFVNLSYIPHYELYIKKYDLVIRNITIFVMLINIPISIIFISQLGIWGASYSSLIVFLIMYTTKYLYSRKNHYEK